MDTEILSSSDLSKVLKEVLPVAVKWYNLGLELGFEPHELDNIRASHSTQVEDCLREILKKWLSHHSLSPTWRSLVAALKVSTVDSPCVAAQIKGKYADPPDQPVQMNTYTSDSNEAGSSGDIPNMSDITKNANSIIKSDVTPVQPQQQVSRPIVQREQRGVQTEPSVASVANKPIKRDRDESTDSELPKPKKQASKYANKKYEFVETVPQDLLCQKCSQLASDPHQMKCCHKLYCECCLPKKPKKPNRYHRNTSFQECSKGNHKQYESFPDGRSNARIQSLKIMCANNSDGCEWQGELRNLEEHRTQCQKEKIPCNFQEIGCRVLVCRVSVKEHETQDREKHLDCAMKTIVNVKKANSDLQQQLVDSQKIVQQQ